MKDLMASMSLLNRSQDAILHFSSFLTYTIAAFFLDFYIALFSIIVGIIILLLSKLGMKRIRAAANKLGLLLRSISNHINESVLGLKTIKALGAEDEVIADLSDLLAKYKKVAIKIIRSKSAMSNPIEPLSMIFIAVMFAVASKRADFNFAAFLATMYLVHRLFIYTEKFQGIWRYFNEHLPAVRRTVDLDKVLIENQAWDNGTKEFKFEKELEFKNVSFKYASSQTDTLQNINFKIAKGDVVGVIGHSGSGKTTLADLLLRLFTPERGEILLDGVNISETQLNSWRRNIGYVSQDIFLKNDTIEKNIKFYDESITEEEMLKAAKAANIYEFAKDLPNGFKTMVGERGTLLSMGQRQRVALARVLARQPQILVLDEATSSLDNQSEIMIKRAIENLRGVITIIIIAHRLSTVADADRIIALDGGKIIEEGSPQKLLSDESSYFYKMHSITVS